MKYNFLITYFLLTSFNSLIAQKNFDALIGKYRPNIDTSFRFIIRKENNGLTLEIVGQGKSPMTYISENRFSLNMVRPKAIIEFSKDPAGNIEKFKWLQNLPKLNWIKTSVSLPTKKNGDLGKYAGDYKLGNNSYKSIKIRVQKNHLTAQATDEGTYQLDSASKNSFLYQLGDLKIVYEFVSDKNGEIRKLITSRTGAFECLKIHETPTDSLVSNHISNRKNGFIRRDTLRGMLSPLRDCYNVMFYDLNVTVDPETKSIVGNNTIRFNTLRSFDKFQIDLFANMKIEKILFHNKELSYTREFNAVFVHFPFSLNKGITEEISISYSGKPQIPEASTLSGGFFWLQDKNGKPWVQSVCQGSGASLWWPCKDHLSDKPDSMKISITVPKGLMDISNGRLRSKINLPNGQTQFNWFVTYPINNYDVALNIGDYAHFSDLYINQEDTVTLDYYCLPYNIEIAKKIFNHTKPMLALYEKDFGKYPFKNDGFTLMESIYPMEHQSAVSIGSINLDNFDSAELIRTMWHESAHEWWGNSVTCSDMADLWIHEAFATYGEVLNYENTFGKTAALKYLKNQFPDNKEPIIGIYNVNDFHLGDVYSKGVLMLNTFRNVLNNDSTWFNMLRAIQEHFKYQSITTEELISYINVITKKDYTYFFDQYLKQVAIPELELIIKKEGASLNVQYKWKTDSDKFNMPVKITTSKNNFEFIYPSSEWKNIQLQNMKPKDFKVDTQEFYITVKKF